MRKVNRLLIAIVLTVLNDVLRTLRAYETSILASSTTLILVLQPGHLGQRLNLLSVARDGIE